MTKTESTDGGLIVRWSSATNRNYTLWRATNLLSGFSVLAAGLPATPPENAYTDSTASADGNYYDVKVVP